jgi:hypothetical protein
LESVQRTQHLVDQVLEALRELSYEAQRQNRTIEQLQARVAELEAKEAARPVAEPARDTVAGH